jgi:hypothetical protein
MKISRPGIRINRARRLWLTGMVIGFTLLIAPAAILRTRGPLAQSQTNDVDYEDEILKGRDLMRRHQYEEALNAFKRANDTRGKKSPECFLEIAGA